MTLLCLFRLGEEFSDILGVDEWPHEIISSLDGFDPRGFCQKTYFCMKISYG